MTEVPVIDISPFTSPSSAEKQRALAQEILQKFSPNGFIGINAHGLDPTLVRQAFDMSKKMFALPTEDKMKAPHPDGPVPHRGYSAPGREQSHLKKDDEHIQSPAKSRPGKWTEYKESYEIGHEENKIDYNIWLPNEVLPGFRDFETKLFAVLHELCSKILDAFILSLNLTADEGALINKIHSGRFSQLRLLRYPPCEAEDLATEEGSRLPAHSDWGSFTILVQEDVPGLQFEERATGQFVDATPQNDVIYVNAGDVLERLSNGTYPAALHRVVRPATTGLQKPDAVPERYSIVFFVVPDYSEVLSVPETLVKRHGEAKYKPMTFTEYAQEKASWTRQKY